MELQTFINNLTFAAMTKESFTLHASAIINGYSEVRNAWQVINEVAAKMDGKVFNKRFTNAVNDRISNYASVFVDNTGSLEIFLRRRDYKDGTFTVYFDDKINYRHIWSLNQILTDGRINADKVSATVSDNLANIDLKVEQWADAEKNFVKYEKKVRKTLATFNDVMNGVNPLFRPSVLHAFNWEKASYYNIYNK